MNVLEKDNTTNLSVIILVYDITNESTILNLEEWFNLMKSNIG